MAKRPKIFREEIKPEYRGNETVVFYFFANKEGVGYGYQTTLNRFLLELKMRDYLPRVFPNIGFVALFEGINKEGMKLLDKILNKNSEKVDTRELSGLLIK